MIQYPNVTLGGGGHKKSLFDCIEVKEYQKNALTNEEIATLNSYLLTLNVEVILTLNVEVEVEVVVVAHRGEVVEEVVQGEGVLEDGVQGQLEELASRLPQIVVH